MAIVSTKELTAEELKIVEEAGEEAGKLARVGITERTNRLKRRVISKATTALPVAGVKLGRGVGGCLERARLFTQSYKETEGEPEVIRRAKALARVLDNMTIFIKDEELLVGYSARRPELMPWHPELGYKCVSEWLRGTIIAESNKEELREIAAYWKPICLQTRVENLMTEEEKRILGSDGSVRSKTYEAGASSPLPDYDFVIRHGFNGIIKMIEGKLAAAEDIIHNRSSGPELVDYMKKVDQWKAMIIADKAAIRWARRYSELAAEMANCETDAKRKAELEGIAKVCANVPANPADHFQEVLQVILFVYIIQCELGRLTAGSPMRIDQHPWPAYKRDVIEDKTLSRSEAQELVELFRLKFAEFGNLGSAEQGRILQGTGRLEIMVIGGVKADGTDACNELTEVILDASRSIRTNQPSLALRWHPRISQRCMLKALDCVRAGLGYPSFYNDPPRVTQLVEFGATIEEARNWAMAVCMSPSCMGSKGGRVRHAWDSRVVLCLSYALSDGYDYYLTKSQLGPHTGDASKFKSFEEVWDAWKKQLHFNVQLGNRSRVMCQYIEAQYLKEPFLSSTFMGCIERGVDGVTWDELPNPWFNVDGLVDVGDSLTAIKKLIFEDKKYTMEELVKALRANWKGCEKMRQDFINAPKYGNDDDYADFMVRDVLRVIIDEAKQVKDYSGVSPKPLPQEVSQFTIVGEKTAALPSGRCDGDVLADGGCSPYIGYDKKGPTAVINSAAKLDNSLTKGNLLNQRLTPATVRGEKGAKLWLNYMKTLFNLGVDHVQFNIVDTAVLHAAQKEPEKFPDLIVRVAGYSAYFNELNRSTQDAIIARTEQVLA